MSPYEQLVSAIQQAEADRLLLDKESQAHVVALLQEHELREKLKIMPEHRVQQAHWRHRVEQSKRRRRVAGAQMVEQEATPA